MKKLLTLAALIFVTVAASAQITWSVKGGVGLASYSCDDVDMDNKIVARLGVGIEYPLTANWSLMPSLELALKGATFSESYEYSDLYNSYTESWEEDFSVYYLQIPILAAYRLNLNDNWNMTIKAGPYFAYGLFGNGEYKENSGQGWKENENYLSWKIR